MEEKKQMFTKEISLEVKYFASVLLVGKFCCWVFLFFWGGPKRGVLYGPCS